MVKKLSLKGLEAARKEFNNWQGNAVIFVDFDAMDAWCEVAEIRSYDAPIFSLVAKDNLHGRNDKYNLGVLESVAYAKHEDFKNGYEEFQINDDYRYSELFYVNK